MVSINGDGKERRMVDQRLAREWRKSMAMAKVKVKLKVKSAMSQHCASSGAVGTFC